MPVKYSILSSHADAKPKAGIVTAPGLYGQSTNPPVQNKNYKVRPNSDKVGKKSKGAKSSKMSKKGMY